MNTVIVFASGDPLPHALADELPEAELVIAADGGYDLAMKLGQRVDVLVGDLDSVVEGGFPAGLVIERHPVEKDASDLELALVRAAAADPSRIVVIGGGGGRLDHELAVAAVICSPRWDAEVDWVSGRGRAHVVRGGTRRLHGDVGSHLSLLAVGGPAIGVTTSGLRWNLAEGILEPGSTLGLSNVLESPVPEVRVASGTVLCVFG